MEYEFINDSLTGSATAKFSMEHEVMGAWLEVEIGKNLSKLSELLEIIDDEKTRQQQDVQLVGVEYTLTFSEDSVQISPNSSFENDENEVVEIQEGLMTDYDASAECGIEDFKVLLINWSAFIKSK